MTFTRPILILLLSAGCVTEEEEPIPPAALAAGWEDVADGVSAGPAHACDAPAEGIARFREDGLARGLTESVMGPEDVGIGAPGSGRGGAVVAADLDGDDDLDLLVGQYGGPPVLYRNDGAAQFTAELEGLPGFDGGRWNLPIGALGVGDFDGKGVLDAVAVGPSFIATWRGVGDGTFEEPVMQRWETSVPGTPTRIFQSLSLADLDGDGDLDLATAAIGLTIGGPEPVDGGAPDLVLFGDGLGNFAEPVELVAAGGASRTMVALFTDRDADGDPDLFIPGDLGPPSGFWRNDGATLTDDAPDVQADIVLSVMGVDTADLDEDGLPDYCMTDRGAPTCLLSGLADGQYTDGSLGLGLTVAEPHAAFPSTIGWSIDLADLDNDGYLDAVQSSGPDVPAYQANDRDYADLLWAGGPEGFRDATREVGFGDTGTSYGLVTADLDDDGWLDIVVVGPGAPPLLWMNSCGTDAWTDVDPIGPRGAVHGIGARVVVEAGGRSWTREVTSVRGQGQGPTRVHVGLGEVEGIDRVTVHWPGGTITTAEDLPVNRRLRVSAP